jgi:hypothetical protein
MSNHKRRLERLERGRKRGGFVVILVHPGETPEEVKQNHLADHPEAAKGKGWLVYHLSGQTSPSAAQPPRPEASAPLTVSGTEPIQITR